MKRLLLFFAAVAFSVRVDADPPPSAPLQELDPAAALSVKRNAEIEFGKYRAIFGETTLDDVRGMISLGTILETRSAQAHEFYLCYTALHEGIDSKVWIVSDAEIGGNWHSVTRFVAVPAPNRLVSKDCPALPSNMEPVGLEPSIWLGSDDEDLERYVGPISRKDGAWRSYRFKTSGKCEDGHDRMTWLATKLERGRITLIHAGQFKSC